MPGEPTPAKFSDRLRLVLAGRKPTPWCENLLIPSGTMSRMFKGDGVPPTYETLAKITRTENVSLSWLIEGMGSRFISRSYPTAEHLFEALEARAPLGEVMHDKHLDIAVLSDSTRIAFVLHKASLIAERRGNIEYREVEILAGPLGAGIDAYLRKAISGRHVQVCQLTSEAMDVGVAEGWGSLELFGPDGACADGGLLHARQGRPASGGRRAALAKMAKEEALAFDSKAPNPGGLLPSLLRLQTLLSAMTEQEVTAVDVMATAIADRVESRVDTGVST